MGIGCWIGIAQVAKGRWCRLGWLGLVASFDHAAQESALSKAFPVAVQRYKWLAISSLCVYPSVGMAGALGARNEPCVGAGRMVREDCVREQEN